ncbi:MAG: hypothetical protein ACLSAF_16585 [Intestinimonas sp.]
MDKLGDEAHAAAITVEGLWKRYQSLLACAPVELYYCGSAGEEQVAAALTSALAGLPRAEELEEPECGVQTGAVCDAPRLFTESMDVTQGKLALGFRTGAVASGRRTIRRFWCAMRSMAARPHLSFFSMSGRSCPCAILQAPCWKSLKVS